jgi:subtilisin family serine protease
VVDTGIDYNHPDLAANMWANPLEIQDGIDNDGNGYIDDIHGINALTGSGDPMDDHSHGTHVAGTIGAVGDNGLGLVGVVWNVKMIAAKSFDSQGEGLDSDAIACIDYIIDLKTTFGHNIAAINASWGGGGNNQALKDAIDAAGTAGIIFCAAAGNSGINNDIIPHYPSSFSSSNLIAVTATDDKNGQHYNYGAASVDLGAPGYSILSTMPGVYDPVAGDIFFDDMESGSGKWSTGGTQNTWAITTDQEEFSHPSFPVPSPPHFWSDSPGEDYAPETDSWLMNSSDIDLTGYLGQAVYLGFGSAMFVEDYYDHAYMEVSGNSGSTWMDLADFSGYEYYWQKPYSYMIPEVLKTDHFRFRFHLVTDDLIEYWGWLIDDIGIGTGLAYGYGYKNGTSMATPHVTGAVALLASQFPGDTVAERISRIYDNVTLLPSLTGKCATNGMLNLHSALVSSNLIWGTIKDSYDVPVPGIVLDGLPGQPITNGTGFYKARVAKGWSGVVAPVKSGFVFTPLNRSYSGISTDQADQDFTGLNILPHTASIPISPAGPANGKTFWTYTFTTGGSICSHGHEVKYQIDWGDGTYSGWWKSGEISHSWGTPGTYSLKARARCAVDSGVVSGWSEVSTISILSDWSPLNRTTWTSGASINPCIKTDSSGTVFLFWQDDTSSGHFDLYHKKSTDKGDSWRNTVRLSYTARTSSDPEAVLDPGGNIHLFWSEYYSTGNSEIVYKKSTDDGANWSYVDRLIWTEGLSLSPSAVCDSSGLIHLVWEDRSSGCGEIYYKKSTDGGTTWSAPTRLTYSPGEAGSPCIAVDSSDNLHLVWTDTKSGNPEIIYKHSVDSGASWTAPRQLIWNTGDSLNPFIAASSGSKITIAWEDNSFGNYEIFTINSSNKGTSWEPRTRETWNSGASRGSFYLFSGTAGSLFWQDNTTGDNEIFLRESIPPTKTRITWNSGDSIDSKAAAAPDGTIYLIWTDDLSGNYELYFKKR